MGAVKTLDREYLSTHPEGDEQAKLTFSSAVPASVPVPANPDGTRPSVTLQVTGDNYMDLIEAMNALREDEAEQFLWELIEQVIPESAATSVSSAEEATELLKKHTHEVVVPFRTLPVEMTIERTDPSGTTTSSDVVFELTTPSLSVGVALAMDVASPQKLGQLMVGLSPRAEGEDGWSGDEVLVVS